MPVCFSRATNRLLQLAAALTFAASPSEAGVTASLQNCGPACTVKQILITGDIDRNAYEQFLQILKSPKPPDTSAVYFAPQVRLNATGGSIETAMAIGRKIREEKLSTMVFQGNTCSGACVLILAAGVIRVATYGSVGLASLSPAQAENTREALAESVREYLAQMGISGRLYPDMLRVSSGDVRLLSDSELRGYGLVGEDPTWASTRGSFNFRN